jgi:hypothetical protein
LTQANAARNAFVSSVDAIIDKYRNHRQVRSERHGRSRSAAIYFRSMADDRDFRISTTPVALRFDLPWKIKAEAVRNSS